MIIAIDGPSGAGKSSVSQLVAAELGFSCLDTGAMFRSVAWQVLENGKSLDDGEACGEIARNYLIEFIAEPGSPKAKGVTIGGTDVSSAIRTARIDAAVSPVSVHPGVRSALLDQQRRIGNAGNYVVEGRDIGTVVFPDAEVKIFLSASAEERARRRVLQNEERSIGSTNFEEVLDSIRRRDEIDSSRAAAPLKAAEDAVHIDSSNCTIEEVVARICSLAREKMEG